MRPSIVVGTQIRVWFPNQNSQFQFLQKVPGLRPGVSIRPDRGDLWVNPSDLRVSLKEIGAFFAFEKQDTRLKILQVPWLIMVC
jgi:hypothetical protein